MSSSSDSCLWDENNTFDFVFRPLKPHPNQDLLFRFADQSKGDKSEVPLVCAKYLNPNSQHIDRDPRYEISSGYFLCRLAFLCTRGCSSERRTFLPVDRSLPFKYFRAADRHWNRQKAEETAKKILSRRDLEIA